MSLTSDVLS